MKCPECGAEISEDAKFCSYCGYKIETTTPPIVSEIVSDSDDMQDEMQDQMVNSDLESMTSGNKMKAKIRQFWNAQDLFCKIFIVSFSVVVLLMIIAIAARKGFAIFISILQLAGLMCAILMHKDMIVLETKKKWLKYLLLIISVLFTFFNVMSYSIGKDNISDTSISNVSPLSDTSETTNAATETALVAPYGANECIGRNYSTVESYFVSAGFTNIQVKEIEDIELSDADKLDTVESISIDGKADFSKGEEFNAIDTVTIQYHAYKKCNVKIAIDFIPNLIFSKYNVNLLLNGVEKETLEHGIDKNVDFSIDPGEYTITFQSDESSSVVGEVALTVDCDMEVSYKIYCYSDKVSVETLYVDRMVELADGETKLNVAAKDYKHKNYEDVTAALNSLGFNNIKYQILYDIIFGLTENGEVDNVSIAGNSDFKRGDIFDTDAEIIITYHMPEEDDPDYQAVEEDNEEEAIAETNMTDDEEETSQSQISNYDQDAEILEEYDAWVAVEDYGKMMYKKFKLHYPTGVLLAQKQDDNTWNLKALCDVDMGAGEIKNCNCEATVEGTNLNAYVTYFIVY